MHNEKSLGIEERGEPRPESLQLLIEGEQKLLALFDARQANADARMTAAATGALALPAAALTLAEPLGDRTFKWMYAGIVVLVAIVFMARTVVGWTKRREGSGEGSAFFSSESRAAATAREEWRRCEATDAPIVVQERALKMWRTRAQHSREIAQIKDAASVLVALAFVIALIMLLIMVAEGEFWTEERTATDNQQQRGEQPDQR